MVGRGALNEKVFIESGVHSGPHDVSRQPTRIRRTREHLGDRFVDRRGVFFRRLGHRDSGRFYQNLDAAAYNRDMLSKVEFQGVADCFELSNGTAKVVVASDFGPRIIGYSLVDGANVLG